MNSVVSAAAKLKMLKLSIRCLVFGLLGLLPVIGLPFALAALWLSGSIRVLERDFWNAAKPYRVIGMVCAALSTVFWVGVLIVAVGQVLIAAYG